MLGNILRVVNKINDIIERLLMFSASAMFVIMIGCNALEIFTRTVFSFSFPWVQELSILFMSGIVFFAGAVVYRKKRDAAVLFIVDKIFKGRSLDVLFFIYNTVIILYLGVLMYYAIKLQPLQAMMEAVYLPIKMNLFSFPIVIFTFASMFAFIEHNIEIVMKLTEKGGAA